jgi:hypothetical protein
MDSSDSTRIPAYLLRRMDDGERDAFEARLLEEPELLKRVQALETALLSGARVLPRLGALRVKWFAFGVVAGTLLAALIFL